MPECRTCHGGKFGTVTIMPRLEYADGLLAGIIHDLELYKTKLRTSNMAGTGNPNAGTQHGIMEQERTVLFATGVLSEVRHRMGAVSGMSSIPGMLIPAIPAVRAVSARLYGTMPACNERLCELSVHLGSIVMDSAVISTARFDFGKFNRESAILLDKVKLITDSKINEQYHNLPIPQH